MNQSNLSSFIILPSDIILYMFRKYFGIKNILNSRLLNKYYNNLTKHKSIWEFIYRKKIGILKNSLNSELLIKDIIIKLNMLTDYKLKEKFIIENDYLELFKYFIKFRKSVKIFDFFNNIFISYKKIYIKNNDYTNMVYCCSKYNSINIFNFIVNSFYLRDLVFDSNKNPFYEVCRMGYFDLLKSLLQYFNLENIDTHRMIYICAKNGYLDILEHLIDYFNIKSIKDINYNNAHPFFVACQEEHLNVIKYLVNFDINPVDIRFKQYNSLYCASKNGHVNVVNFLLENYAFDINEISPDGSTCLYIAVQNGHYEVCKILLEYDADVNFNFLNGYKPIYIASQNGYLDIVKILKNYDIEINEFMPNGSTCLYIACQNGHYGTVKNLLKYDNIDINLPYNGGYSPLYVATLKGYFDIVKILIANNADINQATTRGATPLYVACQKDNINIVEYLINHGADINSRFDNGFTPIFIAISNKNISVVKMLIKYNADILLTDNKNCSVIQKAKEFQICVPLIQEKLYKFYIDSKDKNLISKLVSDIVEISDTVKNSIIDLH